MYAGEVSATTAFPRLISRYPHDLALSAEFEKIADAPVHPVEINEINYKSAPETGSEDWIELFNNSGFETDISGWYVSDDNDDHRLG